MRISRLLVAACAAVVLAVLAGGPAWAHNSLTDASPAKNATLQKAPERVKLTFLQRVDPQALSIVVTDAAGRKVPAAEPDADGRVGTLTFEDRLANGGYTVTYRVVSLDGHAVRGSYRFTVDDPSASAAQSSAAPSSAAPSAAPSSAVAAPVTVPASAGSDGAGWWPVAAGIAVVLLLAAGALVAVRRHRNP